jgi:hypothetical protein
MAKGLKMNNSMMMVGVALVVAIVAFYIYGSYEGFQSMPSMGSMGLAGSSNGEMAMSALSGPGAATINGQSIENQPIESILLMLIGMPLAFIAQVPLISKDPSAAKRQEVILTPLMNKILEGINPQQLLMATMRFYNTALDAATKKKSRSNNPQAELQSFINDYNKVQLPKLMYLTTMGSSLANSAASSVLLADRSADKDSWLNKSNETTAVQKIADTQLNNLKKFINTMINSYKLSPIIRDVITSEVTITAFGGTIPHGGVTRFLKQAAQQMSSGPQQGSYRMN